MKLTLPFDMAMMIRAISHVVTYVHLKNYFKSVSHQLFFLPKLGLGELMTWTVKRVVLERNFFKNHIFGAFCAAAISHIWRGRSWTVKWCAVFSLRASELMIQTQVILLYHLSGNKNEVSDQLGISDSFWSLSENTPSLSSLGDLGELSRTFTSLITYLALTVMVVPFNSLYFFLRQFSSAL